MVSGCLREPHRPALAIPIDDLVACGCEQPRREVLDGLHDAVAHQQLIEDVLKDVLGIARVADSSPDEVQEAPSLRLEGGLHRQGFTGVARLATQWSHPPSSCVDESAWRILWREKGGRAPGPGARRVGEWPGGRPCPESGRKGRRRVNG